jgi:diguanylate cyclase (GGDEF)-like protein
LPNTDIENSLKIAEKLRSKIADNKIENIVCTISLGVKMFDTNDRNIDEAVKHADDSLYKAKHRGRNCVVG